MFCRARRRGGQGTWRWVQARPPRLSREPVIVGLRDPYELPGLPEVGSYVSALGYAPACTIAAAEVLLGERKATGRLPVSAD